MFGIELVGREKAHPSGYGISALSLKRGSFCRIQVETHPALAEAVRNTKSVMERIRPL
jgi:hypothetical protein